MSLLRRNAGQGQVGTNAADLAYDQAYVERTRVAASLAGPLRFPSDRLRIGSGTLTRGEYLRAHAAAYGR